MQKSAVFVLVTVIAASFLVGCASERMMELKATPAVVSSPPPDKATMVFYRPAIFFGDGIQSSVFDVSGSKPALVGILSAGKKIAYSVAPGQHRFMVISESADFIGVNVDAAKVYYARVYARAGVWKARFSFRPVPAIDSDLPNELASCSWVENTADSRNWAEQNMADISAKWAEYLPQWDVKPNKPMLQPNDGK